MHQLGGAASLVLSVYTRNQVFDCMYLACLICAPVSTLNFFVDHLAVLALSQCRLNVLLCCAGRLLGNIRAGTTVKRTIFKGRTGVRPSGLRLPPPIQSNGVPVAEIVKLASDNSQLPKAGVAADSKEQSQAAEKVSADMCCLLPAAVVRRCPMLLFFLLLFLPFMVPTVTSGR